MVDYKLINKVGSSVKYYAERLEKTSERLLRKKAELDEAIQKLNDKNFDPDMSEELMIVRVNNLREAVENIEGKVKDLKNKISKRQAYLERLKQGNVKCRFWSDEEGCYVNGVIKAYDPNKKTFLIAYGDEEVIVGDDVRIYAYMPEE